MKAKMYHLALILIVVLLPAPGQTEQTGLVYREDIKKPNPAIEGIEKLYVILKVPDPRIKSVEGLVWKNLLEKFEHALKNEGLQIEPGVIFSKKDKKRDIPELRLRVELKALHAWNIYVVDVQTALAIRVRLPKKNLPIKAEVWKTVPLINVTNRSGMAEHVTNLAVVQAKAFAAEWRRSNPNAGKKNKTSKPSDISRKNPSKKQPAAEQNQSSAAAQH